jgi:uncharacterized membrane-anchored protein YitT (DUF2179 family)
MNKKKILKDFLNLIMIAIGAIIAAFAIENFLVPCTILDGGVVGVSIIISNLTSLPLSALTMILNIPFLIIGARQKGWKFIIQSLFAMTIFSIFLEVFSNMTEITDEYMLAVFFGGLVLGIGVGLVIRYGGCLDGTEIIALLVTKKLGIPIGRIILIINIFIYFVAGLLFGWDRAMYSILTYVIVSLTMTEVENGFEQEKGVMIFTNNDKIIKERIYQELGRTVTEWQGQGLISGDKTILYCVISRFELKTLRNIINEIPDSFVTITDINEIIGNHIKSNNIKIEDKKRKEKEKDETRNY